MRLAVAALCAAAVPSQVAQAHKPVSVRVLHWNVLHSGFGTDDVLDRVRQVRWIVSQAPDLVTLNEVTEAAAFEYHARLRLATGHAWFLHHVAAVHGGDGNAILSRFPIRATSRHLLTHQRSVAHATIDVDGVAVNVFSTHLESGNQRERRAEQVELLLSLLARFPPPHIVNADLNAAPTGSSIQPLLSTYRDGWDEAVRLAAAQGYADNPAGRFTKTRGARIDYILVSRDGGLRVTGCSIPDQRSLAHRDVKRRIGTSDDRAVRPSDHNLVVCTLDVLPGRDARQNGPP